MLSGSSFRLVFVFSINSLILPAFPLTSFHLTEASLSAFSWFYTLVCATVQKYHEMSFIYNYSHFYYVFCNQLVLLAQLENVNKLWSSNHTVHVKEIKTKTKSGHVTFKLTTLFIVRFSPQTMQWYH